MAAMGNDRPRSFRDALEAARRSLSQNSRLVSRGLLDVEAERIVISAYRRMTGQKLSRMEFFARMQDPFPPHAADQVLQWAALRAEGRILQHLFGYQEFLDHEYEVNESVLVPRPETEALVLTAIDELKRAGQTPELGLEVGMGSGVISIELLHEFSGLRMIASELMPEARQVAQRNAEKVLGPFQAKERLQVLSVNSGLEVLEPFYDPLAGKKADFLISNPPYLVRAGAVSDEVDPDVFCHEPHTALFAPESDSFYFYRRIAERAYLLLNERGLVFLELPHERAEGIAELFEKTGWSSRLVHDLNQRPRVLIANRKT